MISVPHDYYQNVDGGGASDGDEVTVTLTIKKKQNSSFVKNEIVKFFLSERRAVSPTLT